MRNWAFYGLLASIVTIPIHQEAYGQSTSSGCHPTAHGDCRAPDPMPSKEEFEQADAILLGMVTNVRRIDLGEGFFLSVVSLDVREIFKKRDSLVDSIAQVFTAGCPGFGYDFREGVEYLIWAQTNTSGIFGLSRDQDPAYTVPNEPCSRTAPLESSQGQGDFLWLRNLAICENGTEQPCRSSS